MIWAVGQLLRDPLDRLQGPQPELAVVLVAGADREGQRIEHQIGRFQPVPIDREIIQPVGDLELALDILGHAGLVDRQRDHGGAEALGQGHALRRGPLRRPRN